MYIVTYGDCLAHVGTSRRLATRVHEMARLGLHHGTSDPLCAAYCTGMELVVRWEVIGSVDEALPREKEFKRSYGEPPQPAERYAKCKRAAQLCRDLLEVEGTANWEAGNIEPVFAIGNSFRLLLAPRFAHVWRAIGLPPGPWPTIR